MLPPQATRKEQERSMQCNAGHHETILRKRTKQKQIGLRIKQITRKVEEGKETTCRLVASARASNAHFASCDVVRLWQGEVEQCSIVAAGHELLWVCHGGHVEYWSWHVA
jgi:hypothetical protein